MDQANGSGDGLMGAMMNAPQQQVNLEVVNTIAFILQKAREGQIHGIMMVGFNKHTNLTFDSFSVESVPMIAPILGVAGISMAKLQKFAIAAQEEQQQQQQSKILRPAPGLRLD